MVTLALVVGSVADALAVSLGMRPGTVAVINKEMPDSWVIAGTLKVASDTAQAGNIVIGVISTHEGCKGRSQGKHRGRKGTKKKKGAGPQESEEIERLSCLQKKRHNRQTPLKTVS